LFRLEFVPVLHRLQGRRATQSSLGKLLVAVGHTAVQSHCEFLGRVKVVRSQHHLFPTFEAFDHAVCQGMQRRGEVVFDTAVGVQKVKCVIFGSAALSSNLPSGAFVLLTKQIGEDVD